MSDKFWKYYDHTLHSTLKILIVYQKKLDCCTNLHGLLRWSIGSWSGNLRQTPEAFRNYLFFSGSWNILKIFAKNFCFGNFKPGITPLRIYNLSTMFYFRGKDFKAHDFTLRGRDDQNMGYVILSLTSRIINMSRSVTVTPYFAEISKFWCGQTTPKITAISVSK